MLLAAAVLTDDRCTMKRDKEVPAFEQKGWVFEGQLMVVAIKLTQCAATQGGIGYILRNKDRHACLTWAVGRAAGRTQCADMTLSARPIQVKNFEAFRRSLPADARLYVAKNTLLRLAADRVEGWSELKQARACPALTHFLGLYTVFLVGR